MGASGDLALWGGFECTFARIGDDYRDQFAETRHAAREGDLTIVDAIGVRTLRYPILWEMVSPKHPDVCDWEWHDRRFAQLLALNIRPVVGLVHHGSGPRYTSLEDPMFPYLLAEHGRRVALRYPWVTEFTPVNEPLTTARFSGLYGHWFPHRRDVGAFLRMTVLQCKATLLAMRAIRKTSPSARLVQTEDLGRTWAVPSLQDQADYENVRRWLSLDLLFGCVGPQHPFYRDLLRHGVSEADLDLLRDGEAAPDTIGINHYLTSERFLDDRIDRFPVESHGGNDHVRYADVEAQRVWPIPVGLGLQARLTETWRRYRKPIAITEAHHGCTRDEQLRWLHDVWEAARSAKASGVDVQAVTVWSLAGAVDWNSLLVSRNGHYEPGALDVRAPQPRITAIARAAAALAATGTYDHPVLDCEGWWRRPHRFYEGQGQPEQSSILAGRPILIIGGEEILGQSISRVCAERGLAHEARSFARAQLSDFRMIAQVFEDVKPWAVIDATSDVLAADTVSEQVDGVPTTLDAAIHLAALCAERHLPFMTYSSHRVFGGRAGRFYRESEPVSPVDLRGRKEALKEEALAQICPRVLIIRTGALFGPSYKAFPEFQAPQMSAQSNFPQFAASARVSPTYIPDLAHASLDLLIDDETGIWHLANIGEMTWEAFARAIDIHSADIFGEEQAAATSTALESERGSIMPTVESALERFRGERRTDWRNTLAIAAE